MKLDDILITETEKFLTMYDIIATADEDSLETLSNYIAKYVDGETHPQNVIDAAYDIGLEIEQPLDYKFAEEIYKAISREMDDRNKSDYDDYMDNFRDFDEEDRMAAWSERYNQWRNEY